MNGSAWRRNEGSATIRACRRADGCAESIGRFAPVDLWSEELVMLMRRLARCVLAVVLACSSPLWTPRAHGQSTAAVEILLKKARALEDRDRLDLASQVWKQVLVADPNQPEALAGLVRWAQSAGRADEARTYSQRLQKVRPGEAIATGRNEPVRDYSQQRAKLEEAGRLARNNQYADAVRVYKEVFGDDVPSGPLGIAYYETLASAPNGWASAVAGLQKLVNRYPDAPQYKLSLGRLSTYRPETRANGLKMLESIAGPGQYGQQALAAWRQALIWDGPRYANRTSMKNYLAKAPDAEIQKLYNATPATEPPKVAVVSPEEQRGFEALNAGRIDEAQQRFEAALKQSPRSLGALSGLGYAAMKREDFDSAVEYFEVARAAAPDNKQMKTALDTARFYQHLQVATKASNAGDLPKAKAEYQQALALRPEDLSAVQGMAGVLIRSGELPAAAPLYERLVKVEPNRVEYWRALFDAKAAGDPKAALAVVRQMPAPIQKALLNQTGFVLQVASLELQTGATADAEKRLAGVLDKVQGNLGSLTPEQRLQVAGIYLQMGKTAEADRLYSEAAAQNPSNVVAWEGLIGARLKTGQDQFAYQALASIPAKTYQQALERPNFLRSAALLSSKYGQPEQAEELLNRLLNLELSAQERESTLELMAGTLLSKGDAHGAIAAAQQLINTNNRNANAWKILVSAQQSQKHSREASDSIRRIPPEALTKLQEDPDFIGLMAAVQDANGENDGARQSVRAALDRYRALGKRPPAGLQIQLAWILVNGKEDEQELYSTLTSLRLRTDLTPDQEKAYQQIWSVWSRRRAETARLEGDRRRELAILEAAIRLLPNDNDIRQALAGALEETGDHARAVIVYKTFVSPNSDVDQMAGAIGAAINSKDPIAPRWLEMGTRRYPHEARILNLAGQYFADRGDYARAQAYWREAVGEGAAPAGRPGAAGAVRSRNPEQDLGQILLGENAAAGGANSFTAAGGPSGSASLAANVGGSSAAASSSAPAYTSPRQATSNPTRDLAALFSAPSSPRTVAGGNRLISPSDFTAPPARNPDLISLTPKAPESLEDQVREKLDALDGRNAPYFGGGANVQARDGREGFEKRTLTEGYAEASAVIGNAVRVAVVARPTSVSAGKSDGTGELRLGMLPATATFNELTASGLAAEAQISTKTLGVWGGSTPQDFLVHNIVGGARFKPLDGPLTLTVSREALKDTLLSYAGIQDPVSKQAWGGVVANSGEARLDFGDENRGYYAAGGYQVINGKNVQDNKRMSAMAGAYKRVLVRPEGALTIGFFALGMHYDKNLRYFTFGQGGYFSPQRYVLVSVPVTWRGVWQRRFEYSISGSMGPQSFREDSSPYFPITPLLQGKNGPFYPEFRDTGVNYNLEFRGLYQVTPNWFLGTLLNLNNARNYSSQALSFFVRYTPRPQVLGGSYWLPSVPDWKGNQPFHIGY